MCVTRSILVVILTLGSYVYGGMITPDLLSRMEQSTPMELHSVFAVMKEQVEPNHLHTMTQGMGKKQRRDCIVEYLKAFSKNSQKDLLDYLFYMQQILSMFL